WVGLGLDLAPSTPTNTPTKTATNSPTQTPTQTATKTATNTPTNTPGPGTVCFTGPKLNLQVDTNSGGASDTNTWGFQRLQYRITNFDAAAVSVSDLKIVFWYHDNVTVVGDNNFVDAGVDGVQGCASCVNAVTQFVNSTNTACSTSAAYAVTVSFTAGSSVKTIPGGG